MTIQRIFKSQSKYEANKQYRPTLNAAVVNGQYTRIQTGWVKKSGDTDS